MPLTLAAAFRMVVLAALTLHVFWMYALARTINETVGFHAGVAAVAALFALAMMFPLVWALALLELPDIIGWFRGQRRWRGGRCPGCGYPAATLSGGQCPECATPLGEPPAYRITWPKVRRFAVVVVAAWLVGVVGGEAWLLQDEHRFAREVRQYRDAGGTAAYSRPRSWPGLSLLSDEPAGPSANDGLTNR